MLYENGLEMRVSSVSSYPLPPDHHFIASARTFSIPLELVIRPVDWTGRQDFPCLLDYLKSIDPNEIVLITDAHDVIFCCSVDEIESKFKSLNAPIVHSGEATLYPGESTIYGKYPDGPAGTRYINAGGTIAYAGKLLEMVTDPRFWPSTAWCNQMAFHHWICQHPETGQKIDYENQIFLVYWWGPLARDSGRMVLPSGVKPCLFHSPGRVNGWKAAWWWNYMRDPEYLLSQTPPPAPESYPPPHSREGRREARWQRVGRR